MASTGAEVRFLPRFLPLAKAVAASTLNFSMIRLGNAHSSPSGHVSCDKMEP
ncbi:DUF6886 family protein [Melghirimyces profundicolus]|uniref:DUF6886 family protein n=1 Tax=Melghirimyces profundicolus TaxID=1242148 RepID=UPI003CCBBDCE